MARARAPTAPQLLSRLQTAALADEEGAALAREIAALAATPRAPQTAAGSPV